MSDRKHMTWQVFEHEDGNVSIDVARAPSLGQGCVVKRLKVKHPNPVKDMVAMLDAKLNGLDEIDMPILSRMVEHAAYLRVMGIVACRKVEAEGYAVEELDDLYKELQEMVGLKPTGVNPDTDPE